MARGIHFTAKIPVIQSASVTRAVSWGMQVAKTRGKFLNGEGEDLGSEEAWNVGFGIWACRGDGIVERTEEQE